MKDNSNYITFGKDRYHQHLEMATWCSNNIGNGGWSAGWDNQLPNQFHKKYVWRIESMFGNTTFTFKEAKHLTLFLLRWGT